MCFVGLWYKNHQSPFRWFFFPLAVLNPKHIHRPADQSSPPPRLARSTLAPPSSGHRQPGCSSSFCVRWVNEEAQTCILVFWIWQRYCFLARRSALNSCNAAPQRLDLILRGLFQALAVLRNIHLAFL